MVTIGALSKITGVHIETIRYYERTGLTPRAERMRNGRRFYRDNDARRLAFVRHARELGFDLATIKVLIGLQEQPQMSCAKVSQLTEIQLRTVEHKIKQLTLLREELSRMLGSCKNGMVAKCRIMDAMTTQVSCT